MMSKDTSLPDISLQALSDKDAAIVEETRAWVSNAKFEQQQGGGGEFELCVDAQLSEKWKVLKTMDSVRKVHIALHCLHLAVTNQLLV